MGTGGFFFPFAYGGPDDVGLEEEEQELVKLEDDNESLNDETFGLDSDAGNIGTERLLLCFRRDDRNHPLEMLNTLSTGTDFDFSANNALLAGDAAPKHPIGNLPLCDLAFLKASKIYSLISCYSKKNLPMGKPIMAHREAVYPKCGTSSREKSSLEDLRSWYAHMG